MFESSGLIGVETGPTGAQVFDNTRRTRWFRITGGSNPYSGQEVYLPESTGVTADAADGYTISADVSQLWALDGSTGVQSGTVVVGHPNPHGSGFVFTCNGNGQTGFDDAGFTDICTVTDTNGLVTAVKYRRKFGKMFRCVRVDECCLSAWWCIDNYQVELTLACCTPATLTRVLQFALTNKTGDCTDLPDLVHLVHTGGTDLTWTTGGLEYWGSRQYSATFTLSCDGSDLKGTLAVVDFTGGSATTLTCDLGNTGTALGTFTFSRDVTGPCGTTETLSGTVDIAVASWEDGSGNAITGVVEFGEDEVPPHDAQGPWKTEAEANECCTFEWLCCGTEDGLPFSLTLSLTNKDSGASCFPDTITLPLSSYTPSPANALYTYGPVTLCTVSFYVEVEITCSASQPLVYIRNSASATDLVFQLTGSSPDGFTQATSSSMSAAYLCGSGGLPTDQFEVGNVNLVSLPAFVVGNADLTIIL